MPIQSDIAAKILNPETLLPAIQHWRNSGEKIVFTNGCFDLLHYGHLHYLSEARELGDRLVVGLNSDASVKRLKGPHRPINDELTRKQMLASLVMVDAVIVFEEDTPFELIRQIVPDLLVKGGDWEPSQIVGSDLVLAAGGQVKSLPFIPGYSTTNLEQKILSRQHS
ncbi:MAG: D-glycero-beta-D-manno-heptose 1-phosphate adenylyltransferase [Lewinellaceae bacterium]|nr:D-glycero-beta-D-manno-heptose 1-phosphate adenylyltransferase [Saprospiraceae bacterium]MCB9344000.1 D-glycero-beta-D-manno-heptose 1-phosphate adenylyltransferase [Lewinellaceae bacterium]